MSQPLEEIQDQIVERLHAGEALDPAAVMAAHPEHAAALEGFFRVLALVEKGPPSAAPARLGEFQIVRELGRGGMGVVYEAEQLSLRRRVALKVLPPALGHDARLKARFQREAEAAGRLRHPGIVPVISFGDVAGTPFFAMELVEGRSLARVLAELREGAAAGVPAAGAERRRWALDIAIEMADALAYAHAQGIVHRDVKPGNILLDRAGKPRLTDFGLAQDLGLEGLTLSGEALGSPRYMSPEQAFRRQLPIDHRTDIYSLGVTLYEMLTLRYPYEGATSVEYMHELSAGRVVAPRSADPSIPEALEGVLLRALAKDPSERYAGAAALADDLRAVREGRLPLPSGPLPPLPAASPLAPAAPAAPARKRAWKRVALWAAAGLALLSIAATVAGLYGRFQQERSVALDAIVDTFDSQASLTYRPRVELRKFVSRREPGTYTCAVDLPEHVGEGQEWDPDVAWSVSLDGKEWRPLVPDHASGPGELAVAGEIGQGFMRSRVRLADVLGPALQGDSVTLHHRLDKLQLRSRHGATLDVRAILGAHEFTQTIFLYDELPADYPEAVSNAELDDDMRSLLTPRQATYTGTQSLEGGSKAIRIDLGLARQALPLAAAGEFRLYLPGEAAPFARSRFVRDARPPADASRVLVYLALNPVRRAGELSWMPYLSSRPGELAFVLEPLPAEKEVQLLLDLEQGRIEGLRVVFESLRSVARESSPFDRYWSGMLDVTVPLVVRR